MAGLVVLAATDAAAELGFSGFVAGELRFFPEDPAFREQRRATASPSLIVQPEVRYEWADARDRVTFIPFLRLDADDEERTHADLRELSWLHVGDRWELLAGVGKVFWGVAEARHLVDIINQTDLVEDIDGEDKLGQPMIRFTLLRDWGNASLFLLPYFRERTFPARRARLRGPLPVDTERPAFESSLERWHPDVAVRWSRVIDQWDIGLAHFYGTSREPRLVPDRDTGGQPVFRPHYDLIHQTSVDVQYTRGNWLGKFEAITRVGHGGSFGALVVGFEYTLVGVFGTRTDLGLLGEYLYDGRGAAAPPTDFDDDFFVGARLVLNDPQDTNLLVGAVVDRERLSTALNLEASRRIGDRWRLEVEARGFANLSSADALFAFRRDSYVQVRLAWFF